MINVLQKTSISLLRVYFQGVLYGTLTCHQREVIPVLFWWWFPPPPLLKVKCLPTFLFNRKKKKIWVNFLFFFCCFKGNHYYGLILWTWDAAFQVANLNALKIYFLLLPESWCPGSQSFSLQLDEGFLYLGFILTHSN